MTDWMLWLAEFAGTISLATCVLTVAVFGLGLAFGHRLTRDHWYGEILRSENAARAAITRMAAQVTNRAMDETRREAGQEH